MAAKQTIAGTNLYVLWDGLEISANIKTFDPGASLATHDSTSGNDEVESMQKVRKKYEPSGEMLVTTDTAGDAIMAKMRMGHAGLLTWGYEGSATGKPKWSMYAILDKANVVIDYSKERVVAFSFKNTSGAMESDGDDGDTF